MISIIAGNWKMNGSKKELDQWFQDFFIKVEEFEKTTKLKEIPLILICIPSIFIEYAQILAKKYNEKTKQIKVFIGAQDCHFEDKGAFTGNTSTSFLNEFDCQYSIVGHSERREFENETNNIVAKKSINAINNNIIPLLCIGETLNIRETKQHLNFIQEQIKESTQGVDLNKTIIAYEPVWAIGTGKVPSTTDIEEMNGFIKKLVSSKIKVLYGGSVKSSNIAEISALPSVDGVLVGGASLKGEEFFNIFKNSL